MPGMHGFEVTRELRALQQDGVLPRFPIIASTAGIATEAECRQAGMDARIGKPIDFERLGRLLNELVYNTPV